MLRPDELFAWMDRAGILPHLDEVDTVGYWKHLKDVGSPLAHMSDGSHVPVYLWGDGAQYTEKGDSIMVFCCGFVLDANRSNIFPLWLCKEEPFLENK